MTGKKKKETEKCKYTRGDYKCSREALPGDENCIFHSEDIEGKKEKFYDAFWKEFERQEEHEEEYNFTGFVFPIDFNLMNVNLQGANLQGAVLLGVDLTGVDLKGAILRDANLRGAVLLGSRPL